MESGIVELESGHVTDDFDDWVLLLEWVCSVVFVDVDVDGRCERVAGV